MNFRLFELALKRERLLERIGAQRAQLAGSTDGLRRVCTAADWTVTVGHKLRDNPQWVLLAALALVIFRPRRVWSLAKSGFVLWRTWLAIRRRLHHLAGQ